MKSVIRIIGITIIDFGLIWLLVNHIDPDSSVSIALIYLIPFVFILNLLIAGIFSLFKQKEYSRLFLIYSVIASILMYNLFNQGIDKHQNRILESWEFHKADTTFLLKRWKNSDEFSMSYSLSLGSSWRFLYGNYSLKNNEWILKADTIEMKINGNKLIGFRTLEDTIEMRQIER